MSGVFTAMIPDETAARPHVEALETLRGHFRVAATADASADVELVCSDRVGSAPVLVLARPTLALSLQLEGRRVVPALTLLPRMSGDRSVAAVRESRFAVIDMTVTVHSLSSDGQAAVLLEALAAYRLLAGRAAVSVRLHRFQSGLSASVTGDGNSPLCTIACAENHAMAPSWRIWATGPAARYVFELDDDGSARPPTIRFFDHRGTLQAPGQYEHATRRTWLEVHALLSDPARQPFYGTEDLRTDLSLVAEATRGRQRVAVLS